MLSTILVALDGSAASEEALIAAGTLARRSGAELRLVRVHIPILNVYMGSWNMGGVPIVDDQMDEDQRAYEQRYLDAVQARLAADELKVSSALLDGPVAPTLAEYAAATHPELVVMSTHGHGALSRLWLGSVADRFLRLSCIPTLLIRPRPGPQDPTLEAKRERRDHRILIPLDGSALAEQILEPACVVGELLAAEYYIVRVVEPIDPRPWHLAGDRTAAEHELMRPQRSEAQAYLQTIATQLRRAGHQVQTHVEIAAQPARALLDIAAGYAVDTIAIATHGRGGLERLLVGSVADKIVRSADIPVLVFHPQPIADGESQTKA